jgi:hypothetical protein
LQPAAADGILAAAAEAEALATVGERVQSRRRGRSKKKRAPEKWTPVSERAAAEKLTQATSNPGVVFSIGTSGLPPGLQAMQGAVSYFVSGYTNNVPLPQGVTVGGELVVVRTEGDLGKAYNYVFATSSDGQVCINGPHKYFAGHHFPATSAVAVSSLFGHHPFPKK